MEGWSHSALGCNKHCVALHPTCQRFARTLFGGKEHGGVSAGINLMAKDSRYLIGSFGKVSIDSAQADSGFLGNFSHRCVDTGAGENDFGGF
jgi:hypothetical protein